jgi:excisionase family DNA binding protein
LWQCGGNVHPVQQPPDTSPDSGAQGSGTSGYPEILTTAMAADLLHVHVEYLRRMVREGRIPAHRFPGGREIRFLRDELIAWVRDQPGEDRSPSASERGQA